MKLSSQSLVKVALVSCFASFIALQATAQSEFKTARKVGSITKPDQSKKIHNSQRSESGMSCLIEPGGSSQVAAGAPGVLAEVKVDRGDQVKAGQIIAVLDRGVETAALDAARARAKATSQIKTAQASRNMALQKYSRVRKLESLSYGAKLELELAKGELSVAEHRLQQAIDSKKIAAREHSVAQQQLEQRLVRSPIDGVVADRLLNPGERADGRPIVRIIQLSELRVEVILPAEKFGDVDSGMVVQVTPSIKKADAIDARVVQVDRFIDPASGTFRARLAMENSSLSVPAGVRCEVSFEEKGRGAKDS